MELPRASIAPGVLDRTTDSEESEDSDDEFTATLDQVGRLVLPRFSVWPHASSLKYDPRNITKRLSAAASYYLPERPNFEEMIANKTDDLKSLCMNLSESFAEVVNSAVEYPIEDIVGEDVSTAPTNDPTGVEQIKQPEGAKISLIEDRLANYDHLTYLTFEQFSNEQFLRRRIKEILGLDLSPWDQRFLIQKLMSRTYQEKQKFQNDGGEEDDESNGEDELDSLDGYSDSDGDSDDEVILNEKDTEPTYFNVEQGIFGCKHYQSNCKIECAVCKRWYPCRFCHDQEVKSHRLPRKLTRHVLCMFCNTPQYPQQFCVKCNRELARYYCNKCKLYDNDPMKHIYHCDRCGICRLGLGLNQDYFHCDNCNACISIELRDHHICIENSTHSNCPICDEYMFDSNKTVVFMSCGHPIHQSCYDEFTKHSYKCPLCSKTVANMEAEFRVLDREIQQTVMPDELSDWEALIKCIDCGGRSKVPYHYLGLRCAHCKSYNTMQLKILKDGAEVREETSLGEQSFIKNSLDQNFAFEKRQEETVAKDVEDSYVQNFVRVVNSFEKYPSIGEAFKDWMRTSMPDELTNELTERAEVRE
ncbi:DEKNAAC101856 [Brettanomyces naardenensis]|uniref:DEKNAAC101856 n=1 Tax=Brettanomyces naardenensis TaxID=13370 RepID=A0A448YIX8_BRENA|nr:DEKNAAC101856 [Brettanomyces naardenensis]